MSSKRVEVRTPDEIRASVARFNQQARAAAARVRALLRSTKYWVFDPTTGEFGPGKFVGFAGIDLDVYEASLRGEVGGAPFDGNFTCRAIEKALDMEFTTDPHMAARLVAWGEALLGAGAFEGARGGQTTWKFVALPASTPKHWKIAPGEQATFWDENRESGIIAVGWGEAGDPRSVESRGALEAHYTRVFKYTKEKAQANVRMVWWFLRDIKPGHIIVANQGQSKVVGRGVVLGPPEFRGERGEYANCLPVHWFDTQKRDIARQKHWFATVLPMTAEVYEALFGALEEGEAMEGDPAGGAEDSSAAEGSRRPDIYGYLRDCGLHFPAELVTTYLLSLKTKPFVIFSGISGTGKTKLAQAVAEWAGSEEGGDLKEEKEHEAREMEPVRRHEFISVRPDWLDGKEVLGFYNVLTEAYTTRPFLSLLLRAHRDPGKPHFAILDEMNLARVEHYFADLLSATESRTLRGGKLQQEALHLHDEQRCLPLVRPEGWQRPARCASCRAREEEVDGCPLHFEGVQLVPPRLKMPPNVYITGTVNIDETTHTFSSKVLDRANVIEFNEVDLLGYGQQAEPGRFTLKNGRLDLGVATPARQDDFLDLPDRARTTLAALNGILRGSNLHFGYRVANEIALYVKNAVEHVGPNAVDTALDLQVLQKVLPKLHGSKQKLLEPLRRLLLFAVLGNDVEKDRDAQELDRIEEALRRGEPVPPPVEGEAERVVMTRSAAKLSWMLRTLRAQGFVSFLE
ncbi:McrB family protein [Sorangium sp. So ce385]|uniref:McrB family protein n=1 Tax=Sorangium sp. So ce385 TaxID=3133308 RepID=UPI003F5C81CF